jgi:hypothetical protein
MTNPTGNGGMQTADIGALVHQRLDATEGEMIDGAIGRSGQISGPRSETYVSSVNVVPISTSTWVLRC